MSVKWFDKGKRRAYYLYVATKHNRGNQMTHIVMCKVSGGYTGTNIAPLKSGEKDSRGNRKIRYFDTLEQAQAEAKRLNDLPKSPYSLACFKYWAE